MMVYNMNQRSYIQVINLNMIYNHIKFSFIPSTDLQCENVAWEILVSISSFLQVELFNNKLQVKWMGFVPIKNLLVMETIVLSLKLYNIFFVSIKNILQHSFIISHYHWGIGNMDLYQTLRSNFQIGIGFVTFKKNLVSNKSTTWPMTVGCKSNSDKMVSKFMWAVNFKRWFVT